MSSDTISNATKGAIKGILEWSSEKISEFIKKLKEKKLAFIEDPKTIEIVKEIYRSGEAKFYQHYIGDKSLLFLVRLGLALRKLEDEPERLQNIREKIFRKYKAEGLHIAEFVQTGILNRYVGILLEELTFVEELEKNIEDILKNIEKYTIFVLSTSKKGEILKQTDIKVISNSPTIFIICGFGYAAENLQEIIENLKIILKDYLLERFSSKDKEILFFRRKLNK